MDASREGYADDWDDPELGPRHHPHHLKPYHETGAGLPTAANLNTTQIPPEVKKYQTPGPGPSTGIPKRDLELSKLEKRIENIRAIIHSNADTKSAAVRFELSQMEVSTRYLKGDSDARQRQS